MRSQSKDIGPADISASMCGKIRTIPALLHCASHRRDNAKANRGAALYRVRLSDGLCHNIDVIDAAGGWRNGSAIFTQTFKMKLNCFANLGFDFLNGAASSYTPRQVRNVRRVVAFGLFDYDCIAHWAPISSIQTGSEYCLACQAPSHRQVYLARDPTGIRRMLELAGGSPGCLQETGGLPPPFADFYELPFIRLCKRCHFC